MVSPDPHHRLIVLVDIEGFSLRPESTQTALNDAVHEVTTSALDQRAGVSSSGYEVADRGDGLLVLLQPTISSTLLLREMVRGLDDSLIEYNRKHISEYRMRLRVGLHSGGVVQKGQRWTGSAINDLTRLVDAAPVKDVLKAAKRARLALVLTEAMYGDAVRGRFPGIDPAAYLPFDFVTKHQEERRGWVMVPGYAAPPGLARGREAKSGGARRRDARRRPEMRGDGEEDGAGGGGEGAPSPSGPGGDNVLPGFSAPAVAGNDGGEAGSRPVNVAGGDYVAGMKVGGDYVQGNKPVTVHTTGPVRL
ncbi:hypothetical protein [Streptomyces sp. YIM 132580]|uniref:hypothetical protein n=1 Tax=Streptomyces sp. YIM 132580 TaxID=2691958 RepID=UPI0013713259|nr:hypothetical protein [Streptomyces sp. YIM 132580]MXG27622.1 hypothetical protein [Streptomyces sp. YIM 132580]